VRRGVAGREVTGLPLGKRKEVSPLGRCAGLGASWHHTKTKTY
jgi:hypothetical protein